MRAYLSIHVYIHTRGSALIIRAAAEGQSCDYTTAARYFASLSHFLASRWFIDERAQRVWNEAVVVVVVVIGES